MVDRRTNHGLAIHKPRVITMTIKTNDYCPDSTYFRLSEVEPEIKRRGRITELHVYSGEGTRRSWGRPQTWSTVVVHTRSFAAVHVGISHKHRGTQGWFYYLKINKMTSAWERKTWAQLDDRRRAQVLEAMHKAPRWAKCPGKLRTERKSPEIVTGYKCVAVDAGGNLVSCYDRQTRYEVGEKTTEKIWDRERHGAGGLFFFATAEKARRQVPAWDFAKDVRDFAMIRVRAAGNKAAWGDKQCADSLTTLEVVEYFSR